MLTLDGKIIIDKTNYEVEDELPEIDLPEKKETVQPDAKIISKEEVTKEEELSGTDFDDNFCSSIKLFFFKSSKIFFLASLTFIPL